MNKQTPLPRNDSTAGPVFFGFIAGPVLGTIIGSGLFGTWWAVSFLVCAGSVLGWKLGQYI